MGNQNTCARGYLHSWRLLFDAEVGEEFQTWTSTWHRRHLTGVLYLRRGFIAQTD